MEAILCAVLVTLGALLGVFVGTRLTAKWQQRNWRVQQAMQAYAKLFPAGMREIKICDALDYGASMGDDGMIEAAQEKKPPLVDSPFLQALAQCWLLEKDKGIRSALEDMEQGYEACRLNVRLSVRKWSIEKQLDPTADQSEQVRLQRDLERLARRESEGPTPEELLKLLRSLRNRVGSAYFH